MPVKKFQTILFALGVVFLVVLLARVGFRELWRELATLSWGLIPIVLGEGISEMIHTLGWRHCLSGRLRELSWFALFRIRMAGYAINYLTPTAAIGGEVTKGTLLARYSPGPQAASGVLIGKLCFALAHLAFAVLGALLLLWRLKLPAALWMAMMAGGGLVGTGMIIFLALQKFGKLGGVVRWLAAQKFSGKSLESASKGVTAVDEAMKQFYQERPLGIPMAMAWHLVGYSVGIVQTWIFLYALHQNVNWTVASAIWILGLWFDLITFAVPQNIGTLEGSRVYVLKTFGYTAVAGATFGLAQRLAQIVWSCFGLAIYASLVSENKTSPAPQGILQMEQLAPAKTMAAEVKK